MVFNDTTNNLGIIQSCERYCDLGIASISGNTALLKEFTAHANEALRQVWPVIFRSYGTWQYEDSNYTDLPVATDTLTSGQATYLLPTTAHTVNAVEIKDTGGTWNQLQPLSEKMIQERQAISEFLKNSGFPEFYTLIGDTIRVYPPANFTQAASFRVRFDRGSSIFANTDTTKTPGFASEFHGIIPKIASYEWTKIHRPDLAQPLMLDIAIDKKNIESFYLQRHRQMFPPRIRVRDALREAE